MNELYLQGLSKKDEFYIKYSAGVACFFTKQKAAGDGVILSGKS